MCWYENYSIPMFAEERPELVILGIFGCLVVAFSNAANDIANSVGTSYGAGALTLKQAILFGAIAEFAGAVSLGSFVAKSIAKGVIEPSSFAADGCEGVLLFGVGMLSVLGGTGSTTLLATLYGLPISATHGVISGLAAVGIAAHGVSSLGVAPLTATLIAWVASPMTGCITSGLLYGLISCAVHETADPARSAHALQPVLIAATVFIAAAFLVVAGPAVLRIHPLERAVGASAALGIFVAIVASCCAARRPSAQASGLEMLSSTPSSSKSHGTGAPLWGPPEGPATESDSEPEGSPVKKTSSHPGGLDVVGFLGGLLCRTNKEPPPDRDLILRVRDGGSGSIRHLAERYGDKAAGMGHLAREDVEGGASGEGDGLPVVAEEERPFVPLLILSAMTVAFAHGGNDLGNSIGPLAALLVALSWPSGDINAIPEIPPWVLLLGASGFVLGILVLGDRTITTVGSKITKLTPSRSYAVQMGTGIAVLLSTVLGLAVSTSHCLVGSIIGVGLVAKMRAARDAELNFGMLTKILIGWAVTIPLAALVSVAIFESMLPFYANDAICRDLTAHQTSSPPPAGSRWL